MCGKNQLQQGERRFYVQSGNAAESAPHGITAVFPAAQGNAGIWMTLAFNRFFLKTSRANLCFKRGAGIMFGQAAQGLRGTDIAPDGCG